MEEVVTVGLDIAKSVFQVHGVDAEGRVVVQRKLTRAKLIPFFEKLPPCRVGIEACATAHHWGRKLGELGHEVKLMPPSYVKPYLKRQKNDAADAEAICEAVSRPSMRFVEVKSPEQQSVLVIHRTRMTLMRHRIELSNTIRAHMAEFGLAAPVDRLGLQGLIEIIRDDADERVPAHARVCLKLAGRSARSGEPPSPRDRPHDPGQRAVDGGRPAADGCAWRRPGARQCDRRQRARSACL